MARCRSCRAREVGHEAMTEPSQSARALALDGFRADVAHLERSGVDKVWRPRDWLNGDIERELHLLKGQPMLPLAMATVPQANRGRPFTG